MGKSQELQNTTNIVKEILENYPEARNSDDFLYFKVCEKHNPSLINISFSLFILNRKKFNYPAFETVRRSRQKLQSLYPELAGKSSVTEQRKKNEAVFKEYARGNV